MASGKRNRPTCPVPRVRPAKVSGVTVARPHELLISRGTESDSSHDVGPHVDQQLPVPTATTTIMGVSMTIPTAAGVKAGVRKVRKSCSFCARRKKRCNGDGINKCR